MAKRVSKDQVRACVRVCEPRVCACARGTHKRARSVRVCARARSSRQAGRQALRCVVRCARACSRVLACSGGLCPHIRCVRPGGLGVHPFPKLWRTWGCRQAGARSAYLDGPTRLPLRAGGLGTGSLTAAAKVPASPHPAATAMRTRTRTRARTHTHKSMMARPTRCGALALCEARGRHCRPPRAALPLARRYLHDLRTLLLARAATSTSGCAHPHPQQAVFLYRHLTLL